MKKFLILILLFLALVGCREAKSDSDLLTFTVNSTGWPNYGIDLPARTPVAVDSYIVDEPGIYLLLWKVGIINNIRENESNILFYAQLKINDEVEFHTGFNLTSVTHYGDLSLSCALELNAGDNVEIFVTSDSSQWYPTGGALMDNQWFTRNFQLIRICTMDGSLTGQRR